MNLSADLPQICLENSVKSFIYRQHLVWSQLMNPLADLSQLLIGEFSRTTVTLIQILSWVGWLFIGKISFQAKLSSQAVIYQELWKSLIGKKEDRKRNS